MSLQTRLPTTPDPVGLAVALAAQKAVEPNTVILFGSRARGDHRPESDVDLLVICQKEHAMPRSSHQTSNQSIFRSTSARTQRGHRPNSERNIRVRTTGQKPCGRTSFEGRKLS